jgi:hypothetical protein
MDKTCSNCKETKHYVEFGIDRRATDGLRTQCKICTRQSRKAYRMKNLEKHRALVRKWHADHREISRARAKAHYHDNKDRHRDNRMKRNFGISLADYERLLEFQDGKCAICGRERPTRGDKMLQIDHCHKTGVVRGLLCSPCNTVLGFLEDNTDSLKKALAYLKSPPAPAILAAPGDAKAHSEALSQKSRKAK